MKNKKQVFIIGLFGASAVALGAFGAHSLKGFQTTGLVSADQVNGFDTGVKYQMYHTLALLAVFILNQNYSGKYLNWARRFFIYGILLFSGSLYLITTRNLLGAEFLKVLGPVTPIGGLLFILGWCMLLFTAFDNKSNN
ncbi:MAG: DUF423 domain-containing protein [Sphingobacteriaceae bacterium]|nr:DUF423 domain-containing protein [Sphingobacteriaceae bacterium]